MYKTNLCSYQSGSDVEGSLIRVGYPVFFNANQFFYALDEFISIKSLKEKSKSTLISGAKYFSRICFITFQKKKNHNVVLNIKNLQTVKIILVRFEPLT